MMQSKTLMRYAWLSIVAAIITISLKTWAWWVTGSVGLLSDAIETLVNLAGALMALWMLSLAACPADKNHAFGHSKAEYFSSGFEGFLIIAAAVWILYSVINRLMSPQTLQELGFGLIISLVATLVNLVVGLMLLRAGSRYRSISLEADGRHLITDVWTSAAVVFGLLAAWITHWWWLDSLLALLVAIHIIWTGIKLVRRSASGLMDEMLSNEDLQAINNVLEFYRAQGIDFHALRTRQAGMRAFASVHVLVPGDWTVQQGHDLLEQIEAKLHYVLPQLCITTHLEPAEDPISQADKDLERSDLSMTSKNKL